MTDLRLAICASGSGTTLQYLLQAVQQGRLAAQIAAVFADRACGAIDRAAIAGVPQQVFCRRALGRQGLDRALAAAIVHSEVNLLLLAGYLSVIGPEVLALARQGLRIWNLHPSLLPKYGGLGMYGMRVHRAVLAAGETESGCTLHCVSAEVDGGPILAQRRISIADCTSAQQIAGRVQALEKQLLLEYLRQPGAAGGEGSRA